MPKTKDIQSDFRFIRVKIPRKDFESFSRSYPDLENLYLTRAFYFALKSRENFDQIFWSDVNKGSGLSMEV